MMMRRITLYTVLTGLLLGALPGAAQFRVVPISDEAGEVGLGLLLRRLSTTGVFMMATAHPDDENNSLLALYRHGYGYRTVLATATRGDGGQNEIGPELSDALAVLRTQELEAAHRLDGAEQYFTRAIDFGFSFSAEETFDKWGREEIVGDYVRLIRMVRPDVIAAMSPEGTGGGQHHQASALLSREAYRAAGDPSRYPEQIQQGLRPWHAKKYYFNMGPPGVGRSREQSLPPEPGFCLIDTSGLDSLLGRTYAEVGAQARSMHRCQGTAQLLPLPGPVFAGYRLVETTIPGQLLRQETSLFDGVDTSLKALVQYVNGQPPPPLVRGLEQVTEAVQNATLQMHSGGPQAAVPALAKGLSLVRQIRSQLATFGLDEGARLEIDARLSLKEADFEQALVVASGARVEALASDGVVVGGQPITIHVVVAAPPSRSVTVRGVTFTGFDGSAPCPPAFKAGVFNCEAPLRIPADAKISGPHWRRLPAVERYEFDPDVPFGVPFRPSPFRVRLNLEVSGTPLTIDRAVEFRYDGEMLSGEKRMELQVVPLLAVKLLPEIAIIPSDAAAAQSDRELRVTITNGSKSPVAGEIRLELPDGWRSDPAVATLTITREDAADTARFLVRAPPGAPTGEYRIRAVARLERQAFDRGYQVVDYPHVRRRHLETLAETRLKIIDVRTTPNLTVGYVAGVGDEVPQAIGQLGARVVMLDEDELAWGDLSQYDAIVTGVRAYERREDLRSHNNRLIEYAERGGTLIVQYNKFEFNEAQYGPYRAEVSNSRVTDEFSRVILLEPSHPVLTFPNRIDDATWKGWVQERGLYFLGDRDPRYVDLVELEEPFPYNKGLKRGALVEARVGKGRWVYVGLGLWRQLPAGTNGAYQLLANLISLGKAPAPGESSVGRQ
jgi:LmbE family N-acetylglucosaminyl deacetylase